MSYGILDIPGFPGYGVDAGGGVWSKWRHIPGKAGHIWDRKGPWKTLRPKVNGGYLVVDVRRDDGKRMLRKVHQMVLEAFIGPRPESHESRHLDGNRKNNRLHNLEWSTRLINQRDRLKHGTRSPRLQVADVIEIRKRHADGESQSSIGRAYGIQQTTVHHIVMRKTWRTVQST